MTDKHTPGPWYARQIDTGGLHWRVLAGVEPGAPGFGGPDSIIIADFYGEHAEASSRLIAAAPALLDALREMADELESVCTCNASLAEEVLEGTGIHPWECECPEPWASALITKAREAIRLATEEAGS